MSAYNLILKTIFVCTLLVTQQTEGKLFRHQPDNGKRLMKVRHKQARISGLRLRNLNGSKVNKTESGSRRQYLTPADNELSPIDSSQQNGNTDGNPVADEGDLAASQDLPNEIEDDNSVTQNAHLVNREAVSNVIPAEIGEKPLPISFIKPDIRLVPKLFPFRYSKKPDVNVAHVHVEHGVNPCQNGGLVFQSPGGYSCLCRKEFRGKHCQERDNCFPNPCQNGGNCIDLGTHLQCACAKGFKGLKCEESDTCDNNPCKHGATCLDLASGLRCVCPVGYKGQFCTGGETSPTFPNLCTRELDICNPNPCKNGGKCQEKNMAAVCICRNEYKGERCEAEKICLINPCRNNGVCHEDKSSAPCECAQGFTGKYCSDHVCKPNPCLNGGACSFQKSDISSTWLATCKCPDTFKGEKCEIPNPCAGNPSPCQHGVCFDAFNGHHMDVISDHYVCNCHRGYMGPKCDVRVCDKCDTHAKCQHNECVCDDGYYGNGHVCKKLPDPCVPNPCKNFGNCVPFESSYDCRCPFSFVGARCEQQL